MKNLKELVEEVVSKKEAAKAEEAKRFRGKILDMLGCFNDKIEEICESVESAFIRCAKEIKEGKVRPYLLVRVEPFTVTDPDYIVKVEDTLNNPALVLKFTVKDLTYPETEIALTSRETHWLDRLLAEKLLPKVREGNPDAIWSEEYGRIEFGF